MVPVFNWVCVCECDIANRLCVRVLYILYKIWCNTMHHLYLCRTCQCGLRAVLWWHIGILMRLLDSEPRRTAGLSLPSHCLCGKILLTLYSMVWDWRVWRADPMLFYFSPFLSSTFSLSLLSFYRLVLCCWGHRPHWGINRSLPALHCDIF